MTKLKTAATLALFVAQAGCVARPVTQVAPDSTTTGGAPAEAGAPSCPSPGPDALVVQIGAKECLVARGMSARAFDSASGADPFVKPELVCPSLELPSPDGTGEPLALSVEGGPLVDPLSCCQLDRLTLEAADTIRAAGPQDARVCGGGTATTNMSAVYRLDREGRTLRLVRDETRANDPPP